MIYGGVAVLRRKERGGKIVSRKELSKHLAQLDPMGASGT